MRLSRHLRWKERLRDKQKTCVRNYNLGEYKVAMKEALSFFIRVQSFKARVKNKQKQ